MFSKGNQ